MEIRQLKTFIHIVKLGNFSQAAQFQGYTQSTVTTHIQLLEKELNTILFERFGHQLTLTTDGEQLYDYAERIIKLTEEAKNTLYHSNIPRGKLVIGMPESLCVYYFPTVLKEYSQLYPEVQLSFKFAMDSDFRILLRKNMLDIAFFLDKQVSDGDFINQFLWEEPIIMVAAPTHRFANRELVETKDLQYETLILVEAGSNYRAIFEKSLEKANVKPKAVLEICQIQTIKQLVTDGAGITVLPLATVKKEIENGSLVSLPWQGVDFQINAFLVHHKEKWLSPAIKAFIKLVKERLVQS